MAIHTYTEKEIAVLRTLESIRRRPGMYVGGDGLAALHHLLKEVVSNAVDEAIVGEATRIHVSITPQSASVKDNGRGIPFLPKATGECGVLYYLLMSLHAGGKFGGGAYSASGGQHGVGMKAVTALSKQLTVTSWREGVKAVLKLEDGGEKVHPIKLYDSKGLLLEGMCNFGLDRKDGVATHAWIAPDAPCKDAYGQDGLAGKAHRTGKKGKRDGENAVVIPVTPLKARGTEVTFVPNRAWFNIPEWKRQDRIPWDKEAILHQIEIYAALNPGVSIKYDVLGETGEFKYKTPLEYVTKWVGELAESTSSSAKPVFSNKPIIIEGEKILDDAGTRTLKILAVFNWYSELGVSGVQSFVNMIPTPQGGTHVQGFARGVFQALSDVIPSKQRKFTTEDVLTNSGLTGIVSVQLAGVDLHFSSQTKERLTVEDVKKWVADVVREKMSEVLGANKRGATAVGKWLNDVAQGKKAQRSIKKAQRAKTNPFETTKLRDIPRNHKDEPVVPKHMTALLLAEGDSAGGAASNARNPLFYAVLPLRGKIINAVAATGFTQKKRMRGIERVLKNAEVQEIIRAVGAGIGADCNVDDMRYGRIVIAADADDDGAHIRALLIGLFAVLMPCVLEAGRLFLARPPLYKVSAKNSQPVYLYSDAELQAWRKTHKGAAHIRRFKGLGEMQPSEMAETMLSLPVAVKEALGQKRKRVNWEQVAATLEDFAAANHELRVYVGDEIAAKSALLKWLGPDGAERKEDMNQRDWFVEDPMNNPMEETLLRLHELKAAEIITAVTEPPRLAQMRKRRTGKSARSKASEAKKSGGASRKSTQSKAKASGRASAKQTVQKATTRRSSASRSSAGRSQAKPKEDSTTNKKARTTKRASSKSTVASTRSTASAKSSKRKKGTSSRSTGKSKATGKQK